MAVVKTVKMCGLSCINYKIYVMILSALQLGRNPRHCLLRKTFFNTEKPRAHLCDSQMEPYPGEILSLCKDGHSPHSWFITPLRLGCYSSHTQKAGTPVRPGRSLLFDAVCYPARPRWFPLGCLPGLRPRVRVGFRRTHVAGQTRPMHTTVCVWRLCDPLHQS